jgi:hypothetical protein
MMSEISQGLETITIGWMTALIIIGPMTVAPVAPRFQSGHQMSTVIIIKDAHKEIQFKADVVA